jgi:uncharacterized delta-60 repeat protein
MKYLTIIISIISLFLLAGCSSGNPVTVSSEIIPQNTEINYANILGAYELTIDADSMTADLVSKRQSAIGESVIISGKSYFDMSPCRDCFRISGLGYEPGRIIVMFNLRHPFPKGDTLLPPTAKNRLDLDLFDVAMVVRPTPFTPVDYALTSIAIPSYSIENPDGFTSELSGVTGTESALPYVLTVDDSTSIPPASTFNKFEMDGNIYPEIKFPVTPGQTLTFDLYLTYGYGISAVLKDRLNPTYYNPEFNRKASWKVEVLPPNGSNPPQMGNTWDNADDTTEYNVNVKVYDWQIGASVNPALQNTADVYAASEVDHISVEIPGMTNAVVTVPGTSHSGGTGMPDSPLVFNVPVANENLLSVGTYTGLVAVFDQRPPQEFSASRDFLVHTTDGGKTLSPFEIPAFVTYQTFTATVVSGLPPTNGELIWAKRAGGENEDAGSAITTLSDNSTVVTGIFEGTATFGKGEPNETSLTSSGYKDIFIARYNFDGSLQWAKRAGGEYGDVGRAITTLLDNSVVVTGYFTIEATFGAGEITEKTLTANGLADIFIAKYNPDGTFAWAKSAGGERNDESLAITSLSDNSTVATGWFLGTATFGPGESNQTNITAAGGSLDKDIFVARFKPNGELEWAKRAGGLEWWEEGTSITALSDDSTVICGMFDGAAIFGQGETNQTTLTPAGEEDIYIARYNPDGTLAWAKRAGGTGTDEAYGVTALSDNSNVVTGHFWDSAIFGLGEPNETTLTSLGNSGLFIARYNPDGSLQGARQASGPGTCSTIASGITTLSGDTFAVTGQFTYTTIFGQGEPNETSLTAVAEIDIFMARFNPDGTLLWVKKAGGAVRDQGYAITALSDDSTVNTGFFSGAATFGPSESNEIILTSAGNFDVFVARFAP